MIRDLFPPETIREARRKLGLTQSQLAAVLGVDVRTVKGMEADGTGHRPPRATTARLLQAYLDGYRPADWPA